jgi:hypothetical protein
LEVDQVLDRGSRSWKVENPRWRRDRRKRRKRRRRRRRRVEEGRKKEKYGGGRDIYTH